MIHLLPSFKLDEQKTELIFVLDRSGSMGGESIGLAKKALSVCSRSSFFTFTNCSNSFSSYFSIPCLPIATSTSLDSDPGTSYCFRPV